MLITILFLLLVLPFFGFASTDIGQRVKTLRVRTTFEKTVKDALLSLMGSVATVRVPVEENTLDELKEFARENDIEIEPNDEGNKNKAQYVESISAWLEENS